MIGFIVAGLIIGLLARLVLPGRLARNLLLGDDHTARLDPIDRRRRD
jgi:hypothetical protein